MSLFSVNDELVARLRPVAADFELHSACITLLTLTGWKSDQERTYGFIDLALMRAALPHWSKQRLNKVTDVLVKLGAWTKAEDGYQVVGWDKEQRSKASRDEDAARKARSRSKKKVRELFGTVRRANSGVLRQRRPQNSGETREFSEAVVNDNADLREPVTRDATSSPSSLSSDLSSRDQRAAPSAPPPEPICLEQERAKREQEREKREPAKRPAKTHGDRNHRARRGAVKALFAQMFGAQNPGRTSLPKRPDLHSTVANAYKREDGSFDETRARASIGAFLGDGWWIAQQSRPGHSFDAWARNFERYDSLADRDRAAEERGNHALYGH